MKNIKRLRSVIHSTAHHGVSRLCCLHPHLCEHCANAGVKTITLDLFTGQFKPDLKEISKPLKISLNGLLEKFSGLLEIEGVSRDTMLTAHAEFKCREDNWPEHCYIYVETKEGGKVDVVVSIMGEIGEILGKYS